MSTDDLDVRLQQAGARWREHNTDVAAVDLLAATAGGSVPTMVPLVVDQASPLRRRRWIWLSSAAGIAAAVAAALIAVQLGGSHAPEPQPAGSGGTPLAGTQWQLASLRDAHGKALPLPMSSLTLDSSGQLSWSEVCSAYSGRVQVRKGSIGGLNLKQVASRGSSCPVSRTINASPTEHELISSVLSGTVQCSVDSYTLTLTKPGVGTLTYVANPLIDPRALSGRWALTSFLAANAGKPSAPIEAAYLRFDGRLAGSNGCSSFSASVIARRGQLHIGEMTERSNGCTGPVRQQVAAIDSVVSGDVSWAIEDGGLTIFKEGAGELTYQRSDIDPGFVGKTGGPSNVPSATPTK